jgi:hypothetical protein
MAKPLLQLAAIGIVGIGLWKLASFFLLPLLFLLFKIGLIVGIAMLAFWWFNKQGKKGDTDTPPATE